MMILLLFTFYCSDIVSEIIIESAFDGTKQINASIIQHVFDDTPSRTIENYIIMPVVRQRPAVAHSHEIDFHVSIDLKHYVYFYNNECSHIF